MITKLNDFISIIDTIALGHPNIVTAYLISGKEKALVDMGFDSSAKKVTLKQAQLPRTGWITCFPPTYI